MKKSTNFNYCNTNPQSWEFIESRYISDWGDKHFRLVDLVKHIVKSGLASRIYGSTSLDKLVLSNNDPIDFQKEALHITFDLLKQEWQFIYFSKPDRKPEFTRTYDEDKGIEKLNNFIEMVNW